MRLQKFKKLLCIILTMMMVVGMMPEMNVGAETTTKKLYLKPNENWKQAGARFAAYVWGDESAWLDLTDENNDGYYETDISTDKTNVIFFRMDPSKSENNFTWSGENGPVWNRIGDLSIAEGYNCYTINEGAWTTEDAHKENGIDVTNGVWSHIHVDNGSGRCSECNAFVDGIGAKLAGYSLSLDGNIGVNFHMELSEDVVKNGTAKMHFTLPNGEAEVLVSEAAKKTIAEKTYYVFSCEVAAKEMTKDIKAQMYIDGVAAGTEYTYTVKQYADYILENADTYANEVPVVNAMLNYGAYAQTYFKYNTNALANADLTDKAVSVEAGTLSKYAAEISANAQVGTFTTANLVLKSKTEINVTFESDVEGLEFAIDNVPVEAKQSGNKYVLTVSDVSAADLNKAYTFKVTKGSDVCTLEYSAMSYAYTILSTSDNEDLNNVVAALCLYNQAAGAYVTPTV